LRAREWARESGAEGLTKRGGGLQICTQLFWAQSPQTVRAQTARAVCKFGSILHTLVQGAGKGVVMNTKLAQTDAKPQRRFFSLLFMNFRGTQTTALNCSLSHSLHATAQLAHTTRHRLHHSGRGRHRRRGSQRRAHARGDRGRARNLRKFAICSQSGGVKWMVLHLERFSIPGQQDVPGAPQPHRPLSASPPSPHLLLGVLVVR
jgi:hypothetical protein